LQKEFTKLERIVENTYHNLDEKLYLEWQLLGISFGAQFATDFA
jgi:hypothetical protein